MTRTFWPATDYADLPHAFTIESRLANWALQWFGESARLEKPLIVSRPDLQQCISMVRDGSVCIGAQISDDYISYLSSKVPVLLSRDQVIGEHATEFVADLCESVFGQDESGLAVAETPAPQLVPDDMLQLEIVTNHCEGTAITLFVSADAYLPRPDVSDVPESSFEHHGALGTAPITLTVEKSFSMNVTDLFELAGGDFVPISDVDDVSFELKVCDAQFGVGYVGQIENTLNIVVES